MAAIIRRVFSVALSTGESVTAGRSSLTSAQRQSVTTSSYMMGRAPLSCFAVHSICCCTWNTSTMLATKLSTSAVTTGRWLRPRSTRLPSTAVSNVAASGKAGIRISSVLMSNMEHEANAIRMTKDDEARMSKKHHLFRHSCIRASFVISNFVIRHSLTLSVDTRFLLSESPAARRPGASGATASAGGGGGSGSSWNGGWLASRSSCQSAMSSLPRRANSVKHQRQRDGRLAGRHGNDEQHQHLPAEIVVKPAPRHQADRHALQHDLDREEHDDHVPPAQKTDHADAEQQRPTIR